MARLADSLCSLSKLPSHLFAGFRTVLKGGLAVKDPSDLPRPSLSVIFDDTVEDPTPMRKAAQRFDREVDGLWQGKVVAA